MPGTPVIRRKFLWLILPTRVGATVSEFIQGRQEIVAFLKRKWAKELEYRLITELWACGDNRIAVRFAYAWHDDSGNSFLYPYFTNTDIRRDIHAVARTGRFRCRFRDTRKCFLRNCGSRSSRCRDTRCNQD